MPASATPAKLKVPFYGHGRQYHNIKREIDDAFHAVMESEAYVMGPPSLVLRRNSPSTLL